MSDHHLLLQIQMLIAALQVIMNDARDLERRVQESQTVDEAVAVADAVTGPMPGKSVRRRRQPLRFAVAAGAVAKTCFACQREVLQQPVDGRLLNADGTEHSQTCTLRHLMSGGNRARTQPSRSSKSSTARKRSKNSVG